MAIVSALEAHLSTEHRVKLATAARYAEPAWLESTEGVERVVVAGSYRRGRDRGCFLELNAHPERLDLTDTHCQMAREEGVLVSINSDAHSRLDFANLVYGVG